MRFTDKRDGKVYEVGNIIQSSGDRTFIVFITDKGFRINLDAYNLAQMVKFNLEHPNQQKFHTYTKIR